MSRIGKKPITLPQGVKYKVDGNTVLVEGPKGKVSALIAAGITLKTADGQLLVERANDSQAAVHGLTRALVHNAVEGVFTLGYSHPIEFPLPTGVEVAVDPKQTHLTVSGVDRQKVGQVAADMRSLRKPDPYKNKGVRYSDERLKKKAGKTGAK
jgi:large subunit ribosomal protein L6